MEAELGGDKKMKQKEVRKCLKIHFWRARKAMHES